MPAKSIAPLIQELEKAYDLLIKEFMDDANYTDSGTYNYFKYFSDSYNVSWNRPIITVQTRGQRRVSSWYKRGAWDSQSANALNALTPKSSRYATNPVSTDEICIAAEELDRDIKDILVDLAHEIIHHFCTLSRNTYDLGKDGRYHTQTFYHYASQMVGLQYTNVDTSNGYTSLYQQRTFSKTIIDKVAKQLNTRIFDLHRKEAKAGGGNGSSLKKWSCGCTNIRVSRDTIDLSCNSCGNPMVYADKDIKTWMGKRTHTFVPADTTLVKVTDGINAPYPINSECDVCDQTFQGYTTHWNNAWNTSWPHNV